MTDLFGLEQQPKRTNDHKEAAALVEVLKALRAHPLVSWAERQNSGAANVGAALSGLAGRVALMCWGSYVMAGSWPWK